MKHFRQLYYAHQAPSWTLSTLSKWLAWTPLVTRKDQLEGSAIEYLDVPSKIQQARLPLDFLCAAGLALVPDVTRLS